MRRFGPLCRAKGCRLGPVGGTSSPPPTCRCGQFHVRAAQWPDGILEVADGTMLLGCRNRCGGVVSETEVRQFRVSWALAASPSALGLGDTMNDDSPPDASMEDPADAVEALWARSGKVPDLEALLADHPRWTPGELRAALLADQQFRGRTPLPWTTEDYLALVPSLAADEDSTLDLICGECRGRRRQGNPPNLEELVRRFPHLCGRLERQLEIASWFEDAGSSDAPPEEDSTGEEDGTDGAAGDFQHRSRRAVHQPVVHGPAGPGRRLDQHGWAWADVGQCVRGATVVECEIRARVPARSSDRAGPASRPDELPGVLQPRTTAPELGVSHALGCLPWGAFGGGAVTAVLMTWRGGSRLAAGGGSGSAPARCARLRSPLPPPANTRAWLTPVSLIKASFGLDNGVHRKSSARALASRPHHPRWTVTF